MIKYLKPDDFNEINSETILYISRFKDESIDECCGKWKFLKINKYNEILLESLTNNKEKWALEWYSREDGDYGWFPYSKKNYKYRNIEYQVFVYSNLKKKGKWGLDEISRFNFALKKYPNNNKKIAEIVMTRTKQQIISKKQKLKLKRIRKNNLSKYSSNKKTKKKNLNDLENESIKLLRNKFKK